MNEVMKNAILLACYYQREGSPMHDAFEVTEFCMGEAIEAMANELFGKEFVSGWAPDED